MGFLGIEIGPSIDQLVSDYIGENPAPSNWPGDRRDFDQMILDQVDKCSDFVHNKNNLHTRNKAASACGIGIKNAYATLTNQVELQTANEEQDLKTAALNGNQETYAIAAIALMVLVAIVLIVKS